MNFSNPEYFLLLLLLIPYILWYIFWHGKNVPSMRVADTHAYMFAPKSYKNYLIHAPFLLRMVVFVLIILILARPQTTNNWKNTETEGIDIMMVMDISTSMLAEDLKPNRIEAAKKVAAEFINGRPNDNIGLTVFAGESFTQCPMTTDHAVLLNMFKDVNCKMVTDGLLEDGTAIGMGMAGAVSRLKDSKAKSKVIILLTDGSNNRGDISPLTAAQIAHSMGVRVYTIGVGTNGTAPYPMPVAGGVQYVNMPVEIDSQTLSEIASQTDGEFYRATNNKKLQEVYQAIDQLEKTKLKVKKFSKRYEMYQPLALMACLCLLLEILLRSTILKKIP